MFSCFYILIFLITWLLINLFFRSSSNYWRRLHIGGCRLCSFFFILQRILPGWKVGFPYYIVYHSFNTSSAHGAIGITWEFGSKLIMGIDSGRLHKLYNILMFELFSCFVQAHRLSTPASTLADTAVLVFLQLSSEEARALHKYISTYIRTRNHFPWIRGDRSGNAMVWLGGGARSSNFPSHRFETLVVILSNQNQTSPMWQIHKKKKKNVILASKFLNGILLFYPGIFINMY